ncbi:MFS transporter [Pseudomonas fluorescens]|uniref:MFS transporter n=1 Tax=Pseudomonas fluorescens TaxID=294 RepID=UPI0032508A08
MQKISFSPAGIVILSGVVAALHLGKVSPAIPALQVSLNLTMVQAGFLLSLMQLAGMLAGVMIGVFSDGLGLRRSIISGQTILCLASVVGMGARQPDELLMLRALEGLGFLLTTLSTPGLIRQLVSRERLALHLGLWGCYVAMGTSMVFVAGPTLIAAMGWQGCWGVPAICSAAMIIWLVRAVPSDRQRRPPESTSARWITAPSEAWAHRLWTVLKACGPWRVGIAFAMYSGQWIAVIGFLPSIYADTGLSGPKAGALTALAAFINISGSASAALLLHRGISARRLLLVGYSCMAIMTLFAFGQFTQGMPVVRYGAVLIFSAVGGVIPGTLFMIAVSVAPNERTVSTAVGWVQQISSMGMFVMPPLLAKLAGWAGGWHWTWIASGLVSLIGLLLATGLAKDDYVPSTPIPEKDYLSGQDRCN